jgi:hypothetical protein
MNNFEITNVLSHNSCIDFVVAVFRYNGIWNKKKFLICSGFLTIITSTIYSSMIYFWVDMLWYDLSGYVARFWTINFHTQYQNWLLSKG